MNYVWLAVGAVLSGIVGGMGMGGGTLLIPVLTIFFKFNQQNAQGINLLVFIPMSIVAVIIHMKNNLILLVCYFSLILKRCLFFQSFLFHILIVFNIADYSSCIAFCIESFWLHYKFYFISINCFCILVN